MAVFRTCCGELVPPSPTVSPGHLANAGTKSSAATIFWTPKWCLCSEPVDEIAHQDISKEYACSEPSTCKAQRRAVEPGDFRTEQSYHTANTSKSKPRVNTCQSRRSSESLNVLALFEHAGEWWLPHESACVEDCDLLQDSWLGRLPKKSYRNMSTTGLLKTGMSGWVRRRVSGSRHRFVENGFDLDLAYVTSRVIAMGFPGQGSGACFRNPHGEVKRFLEGAHGGHYRIYNLCAEKHFRDNGFPDETTSFPAADHCPPNFSDMLQLCKDVETWMQEDEQNVAVIHCKAGKGRSGTMICALLLYAGAVTSARDALRWFGRIRGGTRVGVTIPSQVRWIAMFEIWLHGSVQLTSTPMKAADLRYRLKALRIGPLSSNMLPGPCFLQIGLGSRSAFEGFKWVHWHPTFRATVSQNGICECTLLAAPWWSEADGLVCVRLKTSKSCFGALAARKQSIRAWWHHSFLQRRPNEANMEELVLDLPKTCIDGLQRDAVHHVVAPSEFRLTLTFEMDE
ncbi:pteN [Symbiodinium pilosum]|uniref:PteN protein n=1 Tax=Symbiodinium pilosum TaxID=2952 RepID=A0A812WHN0_SYMPI|nr:pteN [Symbiodinium pilosum]